MGTRSKATGHAALCTLAMTTVSAGTSALVVSASTGAIGWPAVVACMASVAAGFALLFFGNCRELRSAR